MMYAAVTVATCIITYGICTTVKLRGWTLLVIRLIICCTIPNIMFMICIENYLNLKIVCYD